MATYIDRFGDTERCNTPGYPCRILIRITQSRAGYTIAKFRQQGATDEGWWSLPVASACTLLARGMADTAA
jgi:hypothetical protein